MRRRSLARNTATNCTHSVKDEISVTEFETAERHGHPALDVRGKKDQRTILDDHLEVGVEELEDKVQIRLRREHVQKLRKDKTIRRERARRQKTKDTKLSESGGGGAYARMCAPR
jgi:hypothetical protein